MKASPHLLLAGAAVLSSTVSTFAKTADGKPLVLLLAGKPSHGPGEHEHNAGVQLLAKCLAQGAPQVATKVHLNAEWPGAEELAQADTILFYADGGGGHFLLQGDRLQQVEQAMKRGAGFVALHYAVEFPADKGGPQALDWMGGFFEANWSVNPHWIANYTALPAHPISNGVAPFSTKDEWYFHMRFNDKAGKLTHILSAIAPENSVSAKDSAHGGNPAARAAVAQKKPQTTAWAYERAGGGRGFGFTGGHFHKGWAHDDQRKLVLNAILWTAQVEVPKEGVQSRLTPEDLEANLDPKGGNKPKAAAAGAGAPKGGATPVYQSKLVHREPVDIKADLKGAKELYLVVNDGGDSFKADWANWMEPILVKADGSQLKLTELKPKQATVGWGKMAVNARPDGKTPMRVNGKDVPFGIGAHAPSVLAYDLPENVVEFRARGGVDEGGTEQGDDGATVIFQVFTQNPGTITASTGGGNAASAGNETRYGLAAAQANMATFKTPDGLKPALFAAEPMIQNPTNIDVDHRGRVWAVECLNYRKYMEMRPEGDRVVILEDADGDGAADSGKTFFQSKDLTNPLGICVLPQAKGTKVIVSAAPNVWLLTDKDGDDVAEEAVIIFKVGGVWNYDHQVHSFVFGPDGKFYFNAGNSITELLWPDGSRVKDLSGREITNKGEPWRQGMVYRCDIDLSTGKASNVEVLGHNFRNNYEVCVDSFGTMWQSDNDDDGNKGVRINYVMEHGNYGFTDELTGAGWSVPRTNLESEIPLRHWHLNDPGVVPNLLQTGAGSPTGILINENTALGARFTNQLIHCDAGPRVVRAYLLENDGAGYKAQPAEILNSTDSWYRVSDVSLAPDGGLFVADWYDPGVGGHAMGDNQPGKIMGRIYRVAPSGGTTKAPAVEPGSPEGAVRALQSPNRATQFMAWQNLHAMGSKAEAALLGLWKNDDARLRARALGLLAQIDGREIAHLEAGLKDPDANVRIAAIRLAVTLAKTRGLETEALEDNRELMGALLRDSSPQVRRQIALSLHGAKDIAKIWAQLAMQHDGKDRWYLEALGIGAAGNDEACFTAWLAAAGERWNTPAGRDIVWRLRSPKNAEYLARLIQDPSIPADEKARYFRAFDFLPNTPERSTALITIASSDAGEAAVREALIRLKGTELQGQPALVTALNKALARAKGSAAFIELVKDFGVPDQGPALLETAVALSKEATAADAVKLLVKDPAWEQIVRNALATPQALAVIDVLGNTGTKQGLSRLSAIARDTANSEEVRQQAVRALARTPAGAEKLISLAREKKLPAELTSLTASALRMVEFPTLKGDIDALFPPQTGAAPQVLPPIAELARIPGDVGKGKVIAERLESSCVTCHRIVDKGADFGPALSEIGGKLPKEQIYDAILNPNNALSMGFETTILHLKDGGVGMGIVRSETRDEVVLALPGGASNKFEKKQIVKREKLPTSMMPAGLHQVLNQSDLVNLVEYLASLKPAAK